MDLPISTDPDLDSIRRDLETIQQIRRIRRSKRINKTASAATVPVHPPALAAELGLRYVDLHEYEAQLSCDAPIVHVESQTCSSDDQCLADPYDLVGAEPNQRTLMSCDTSMGEGRCVGEQPDGGCGSDADCRPMGLEYVCVDALCRAPCDLCAPDTGE